jgi:hypothetical protein
MSMREHLLCQHHINERYIMTVTNGNGEANSVHPTKDQTVDITQGQTAVELAVAGGSADLPEKERKSD